MTKIICAYVRGKEFSPRHVLRLYEQVRRYTGNATKFVCLTNDVAAITRYGIHAEALHHHWSDYWCKMEALKMRGPCLWLDLDTTIVGDLWHLLKASRIYDFVALRCIKQENTINSSVMAWRGNVSRLNHTFLNNQPKYLAKYKKKSGRGHAVGDQGFIADQLGDNIVLWQDIMPGAVLSYKLEWLDMDRSNCRVVYFHGKPRPWHIQAEASL